MSKPSLFGRCLLAAAMIAALSASCWAQQRNIRTVLFLTVKSDRADSWKAAVKDYVALMKKAGVEQGFTVWESQSGPWRHAVVFYSATWKEMDQDDPKLKPFAADVTKIMARLDSDTESGETWIDEMQPDMAIPSQEIPKMVRVGRTRVVSGKMNDVLAIFRNEVTPAAKKAGASAFGVAVAHFGTPSNEIHTFLGLNGWADLDGPVGAQKGMSDAEFKAFLAKLQPLIESSEWSMWKFQPDLSYVPPPK